MWQEPSTAVKICCPTSMISSRAWQESAPRTLFATHVDAFATDAQIRQCFSAFGPVEPLVKLSRAETETGDPGLLRCTDFLWNSAVMHWSHLR